MYNIINSNINDSNEIVILMIILMCNNNILIWRKYG